MKTTQLLNRLTVPAIAVAVMTILISCEQVKQKSGVGGIGGIFGKVKNDPDVQRAGKALEAGNVAIRAATLDEDQDETFGQSVAISLTNRPGLTKSDRLNEYVTLVGLTVASMSPRTDLNFTFGVLEDIRENAVSAPAGYIFVTRGALAKMKDESELAGVLAHEIAHVIERHGMASVKSAGMLDAGRKFAAIKDPSGYYGNLDKVATQLIAPAYSRDQESEADRDAISYLKAAGYDPTGYADFIARTATDPAGPARFQTHPPSAERVAALRAMIGADAKGQRLAERFDAYIKPPKTVAPAKPAAPAKPTLK
jgi:predicted Zn-dependent protease